MSQIVVERSHRLPAKAARSLAEKVARRLQHQYGGTFDWDGDRLTFRQTGASGHVRLGPGTVEVLVDLAIILWPLRSRIEGEIRALLAEHLDQSPAAPARGARSRPSRAARPTR